MMVLQTLGAFLAVVGFCFILEVPKRHILSTSLVGAIGWLVYLLVVDEVDVVWATFIASLVIDICAQILARIMKTPVTIFLIGGILPLVPGSHIYRTISIIISGEQGYDMLVRTLMIAGAIALAIFIVDSLVRIEKEISNHVLEKRKKTIENTK